MRNTLIVGICFSLFTIFSLPSIGQKLILGMAAPLQYDSLLFASGFRVTGTSVGNLLGPEIPDSIFIANVIKVKGMKCKLYMCNVLFPGSIKIAGPDVKEDVALNHLDFVLRRAQKIGIPNLILGSGGARRIPDGYDRKKATNDFVRLAKKFAELANRYRVTIILENLNSTETNFLNTLNEAADVVRKVDHPNLRLNADLYHMMKENESPRSIIDAGNLIVYCELAEKEDRALPGKHGEDFTPYLVALKKIGYDGPIMIEGKSEDLQHDVPKAFLFMTTQVNNVFKAQ